MRADIYLAKYDHAKSRQSAKVLIESGSVKIDGKTITKPAFDVDENIEHAVEISEKPRFVSRGGEKLSSALDAFGINVSDLTAIDVGASTGGFTDCLLQRGAKKVYAVDSGQGQLAAELCDDKRVISMEKYNARDLKKEDFDEAIELAVMDVSFISQTYIHGGINNIICEGGYFISLIKPQFECGRRALNSKGIVKSASDHRAALIKVIDSALICGFSCLDVIRSPIEGGSGNVEFLGLFQKSNSPKSRVSEAKIKAVTKKQ